MTNFPSILARLGGMFGEERTSFLDSLGDYDLLIIDDLGVERNTEYAMEQIFSIIDSRYYSGKPLIVTTNLKLDELKHPPDLAHAADPARAGEENRQDHLSCMGAFQHHQYRDNGGIKSSGYSVRKSVRRWKTNNRTSRPGTVTGSRPFFGRKL